MDFFLHSVFLTLIPGERVTMLRRLTWDHLFWDLNLCLTELYREDEKIDILSPVQQS